MNMHSNFSEWFLAAGIEWPSEVLEKRWVGVETFSAGRDEIVSLVELFFAFYEGNETFIENFRVPFKQADSAFRMKDNNRELSVLAGAKLVSIMENGSVLLGDFASMALVSCGAQNLRASACVNDIAERAAKHLNARAIARSQPDPNAESEDDETTVLIKTLQRDLNVVAEESNMLWWVFGETSRDTGKRWSDYSVTQAALMAGKELARSLPHRSRPCGGGGAAGSCREICEAKAARSCCAQGRNCRITDGLAAELRKTRLPAFPAESLPRVARHQVVCGFGGGRRMGSGASNFNKDQRRRQNCSATVGLSDFP